MSERETRFIEAYMGPAAGNGTEACRLAGYKGSSQVLAVQATRLLSKANVQSAIADRRKALESQSIADAKERREILTHIARAYKDNPIAATNAIDKMNKMDGVYVEKHEHDGDIRLRWGG